MVRTIKKLKRCILKTQATIDAIEQHLNDPSKLTPHQKSLVNNIIITIDLEAIMPYNIEEAIRQQYFEQLKNLKTEKQRDISILKTTYHIDWIE